MTTTRPTRPTAPEQPLALALMIREHNDLVSYLNKITKVNPRDRVYLITTTTAQLHEVIAKINAWNDSPEGKIYNAKIDEYNRQARIFNDWLRRERQAKINAREINKIRSARCPKCFCDHRPEVECY